MNRFCLSLYLAFSAIGWSISVPMYDLEECAAASAAAPDPAKKSATRPSGGQDVRKRISSRPTGIPGSEVGL
jgi:hypothetical protein